MVQVRVGRRFTCGICLKEVWICRRCDRGNRYCSGECQLDGRRRSNQQAGRTFRAKEEGKQGNARRQRDWYRRQKAREETADSRAPDIRASESVRCGKANRFGSAGSDCVYADARGSRAEKADRLGAVLRTARTAASRREAPDSRPGVLDSGNLTHQGSAGVPSPSILLPQNAAHVPAAPRRTEPTKPEIMRRLIPIDTANSLPERQVHSHASALFPRCHFCGRPCREGAAPLDPGDP
jgi:hypothetical protein